MKKKKTVLKKDFVNSFKRGIFFGLGTLLCGSLIYAIGVTVENRSYTAGEVLSADSFNKITQTLKDVYNEIGSIGIGTDDPQDRLDVNGKIRMRQQTIATDSPNIVATKSYVDTVIEEQVDVPEDLVASNCIDTAYTTIEKNRYNYNIPQGSQLRFLNTCCNRFCRDHYPANQYRGGRGVEFRTRGDGVSVVTLQCFR